MKPDNQFRLSPALLTVLRILIGWHFLYEGLAKLAMPGWSSYSYLMQSSWLFAGSFHWIASHPGALAVTDFLNIWGLVLIGTGLFAGLFTRAASVSGILLLGAYYVANPPFSESGAPVGGQYFFVNMNLIEAGILLVFVVAGKNSHWCLDGLFHYKIRERKEKLFPQGENQDVAEPAVKSRRELIKNLASLPLFGIAFFGMAKKIGWVSFEENQLKKTDTLSSATVLSARAVNLKELKGKVPRGKIKDLEISRLIPGGNLVAGFAHARDLLYVSPLIKTYFTDEKVIETLWIYEACGINTTIMRNDEQVRRILNKFWKRGGKIQWLAQTYPDKDDYTNIQEAIDNGASAAFVMGGISDKLVFEKQLEYLEKAIRYIRSKGLISGTAGHAIQVPMACVDNGIEVDFFMKTFHHDHYWSAQPAVNRSEFMHNLDYGITDHNGFHDNLWCPSSDAVAGFFKKSKIPWIAYKVLAAGAIPPEDGFKFAFENGADFICVGMFDFQVISNVNSVAGLLSRGISRERAWYA